MAELKEELSNIVQQEKITTNLLRPYYKLDKYENVFIFIRFIISFVITVGIVALLYLLLSNNHTIEHGDWLEILFFSIYPGCIVIIFLISYFGNFSTWLNYKFTGLNPAEHQSLLSKQDYLRQKRLSIQSLINAEERKAQQITEKRQEHSFLIKINEAVITIERKLLSFQKAVELQTELENEFTDIKQFKYYYFHTNQYYQNRLDRIAQCLKIYNVSNVIVRSAKPIQSDNIIKTPSDSQPTVSSDFPPHSDIINETIESEPKSIEAIDDHFTQSYKPVLEKRNLSKSIELPFPNEESSSTEHFNDEIALETLLKSKLENSDVSASSVVSRDRAPVKRDYAALNDIKSTIGFLGEAYALEWERDRLKKSGLNKYIDNLKHISLTDDSIGYDILSFNEDGSYRYIEVKTTTEKFESVFYLSETEREAMYRMDNYFVYRVHNFDISLKRGDMTIINCAINMDENYNISPISYKVYPK